MENMLTTLSPVLLILMVIGTYIWVVISAHRVSPAWGIRGLTLFPVMPIAFAFSHPLAVWKPAVIFVASTLLLTPFLPQIPVPDFAAASGFESAPSTASEHGQANDMVEAEAPEKPFYQFEQPTTPAPAHSGAGQSELDEYRRRVREMEAQRLKKSEQSAEQYYRSADSADRHMTGSTLKSQQDE